ncbi:MAG: hypothetical protein ACTHNG_03350 [Ginsengibacter sp.]
MKTILIAVFSFLISHELFAQPFYLKKFPANNKTRYITNSPTVRGIVFFYDIPSDTNNVVLYIPDFKKSNINLSKDKLTMYRSKICFVNYKSEPGDFIYSFKSNGDMIYFYHPRPGEQPAEKFYNQ